MNEKLKELSIEELKSGYTFNEKTKMYHCIFCESEFHQGVIYKHKGKYMDARLAMEIHIHEKHGGAFQSILSLKKELSGLSDIQKTLLKEMYYNSNNKEISEKMGISISTVRGHKFNLQKLKRQGKILLSLMEYLEDDERLEADQKFRTLNTENLDLEVDEKYNKEFTGNKLHPFFTNFTLK